MCRCVPEYQGSSSVLRGCPAAVSLLDEVESCPPAPLRVLCLLLLSARLQDMDTDLQGLRQPASKGEPRLVSAEHCTPKRGGVPSSLHFPSLPAAVGWTQHLVSRKLGFIFPMSIPLLGPPAGSQVTAQLGWEMG